jgi:hypothetical protein
LNVNYLLEYPEYATAYRADVNRIETRSKMAIKESEEVRKEEEFVNVDTSYKKTR